MICDEAIRRSSLFIDGIGNRLIEMKCGCSPKCCTRLFPNRWKRWTLKMLFMHKTDDSWWNSILILSAYKWNWKLDSAKWGDGCSGNDFHAQKTDYSWNRVIKPCSCVAWDYTLPMSCFTLTGIPKSPAFAGKQDAHFLWRILKQLVGSWHKESRYTFSVQLIVMICLHVPCPTEKTQQNKTEFVMLLASASQCSSLKRFWQISTMIYIQNI